MAEGNLSSILAGGNQNQELHYIFAMTWPKRNMIEKIFDSRGERTNFLIHGLWRSTFNRVTRDKDDLNNEGVNRREEPPRGTWDGVAEEIMARLRNRWKNEADLERNEKHWYYQWNKHMNKIENVPFETPREFVEKVNELDLSFDILQALASQGIVPGEEYTMGNISNALKEALGFRPSLQFVGEDRLHQVLVWMNADFVPIDSELPYENGGPDKRVSFPRSGKPGDEN